MVADPPDVLVHIGYPKCASTYLQRTAFPRVPGLYTDPQWERLAFDRFVLTDGADFDPQRVAAEFVAPGSVDGRPQPVVSNENLVCGATARVDFSEQVADRLLRTFPHARILMVVREQRSMVLSLYRQLVKRGESLTLRKSITPLGRPGYHPRLRIGRLRYHHRLAVYQDRFGADRVRVVPYEHLVRDDAGFLAEIAEFATGRPAGATASVAERANVGYRGLTLEMRRRINVVAAESYTGPGGAPRSFRVARAATSAIDRVLPESAHQRLEARYRAEVADVVGDSFAQSNRLLAERTGLDLAALGYDVGS